MTDAIQQTILSLPDYAQTAAAQIGGAEREGADVADVIDLLPDLAAAGWRPDYGSSSVGNDLTPALS